MHLLGKEEERVNTITITISVIWGMRLVSKKDTNISFALLAPTNI
jgi:hypothetical protein